MLARQARGEFDSANAALKTVFSLLVSLAVADEEYAHLKTATYILTTTVGAETIDGLWFHGEITGGVRGREHRGVGRPSPRCSDEYRASSANASR